MNLCQLSSATAIGNLRAKPVGNDVDLLLCQQRWRMSAAGYLDQSCQRAAHYHLLCRITGQQIGVLSAQQQGRALDRVPIFP